MQKITTNLWFNNQAEEAVNFYISIFKNSKIGKITYYGKTGSKVSGMSIGSIMTISFEIENLEFVALNGGPIFKFTPAISLIVSCKTKEEVDKLWNKLVKGGTTLMELGKYQFSEKYGWLMDRYGLSWQIMFIEASPIKQKITPTLMFSGDVYGKAEEAIKFYTSVFRNVKISDSLRYGEDEEPNKKDTIKHIEFKLEGQEFAAMDSAHDHNFSFNEAISFIINCETQEELDYYWEKLSKEGDEKAQNCGWLKDKYGLSWQIIPIVWIEMLQEKDAKKTERVMKKFLKMKKIIIKDLMNSYEGR